MSVEPVRSLLAGLVALSSLACAACNEPRAVSAPLTVDSAPSSTSSASAVTPDAEPTPSAEPTATPAPLPSAAPTPVPHVRVENIGVHIGGGPNDAETKRPVIASVAPHFDDLRACWARVDDPARGGDFGVDIRIGADGGRARVTQPRTNVRPDAFRDCVMAVFEGIDFEKPRHGATTASYSLRFTP